ncbi:MAG TPA: TIGR04283 family arsenosugar biosynthesis glycosyltransferase [Planctomycetota bacterium]
MEPPAPLVPLSVVTPTWNEAGQLEALARSLAQQACAHEWIVSDGESPDGSAELAARLGARVLRGARGRGGQLARGAAAARGELLCFLHADARLAPGALAAVSAAFADPGVCAAGMRQRIEHPARFYRWIERAADRRVARGRVYGDSALCVRRAAYAAAGGFRAQPVFEDLDLARRLRREGRIVLVPGATVLCSPRRWEREGRLRRTLLNWALTGLWAAGVDSARLARFYAPHAER